MVEPLGELIWQACRLNVFRRRVDVVFDAVDFRRKRVEVNESVGGPGVSVSGLADGAGVYDELVLNPFGEGDVGVGLPVEPEGVAPTKSPA